MEKRSEDGPKETDPSAEVLSKQDDKAMKGGWLAILGLAFAILAAVWMLGGAIFASDYFEKHFWESIFGSPRDRLSEPEWLDFVLGLSFMLLPFILFAGAAFVLLAYVFSINEDQTYQNHLGKIRDAQKALRSGLSTMKQMEREYRQRLLSHQKIKSELQDLRAAHGIESESLKSTLRALGHVNRFAVWRDRAVSFVIGVASSLIATTVIAWFGAHS